MSLLGGIDGDERQQYYAMIRHFVDSLNTERAKTADLTRQLEVAKERIMLLEAAAYGLF